MKSSVMYQLDSDDPATLSIKRLEEIQNLLQSFILDADRGDRDRKPHPGLRAISLIKGNNPFTAEDVASLSGYVDILLSRHSEALERLKQESQTVPNDEHSRRAYELMIGSMEAQGRSADGLRDAFVEAFDEERQMQLRLG